jgi:hypothetical protein
LAPGQPAKALNCPGSTAATRLASRNYKEMKDLSKDAARRLTVGEAAAGQRIDNFLLRELKGVPKSHV